MERLVFCLFDSNRPTLGVITISMPHSFDVLLSSYLNDNIGIDSHFLNKDLCQGLCNNIQQLQQEGKMQAAGIGNSLVKDQHQQMRGDTICWMDKKHDNIYEQEFLNRVERLIEYLNRTCYTGINGYEFHYAVYEQGRGYKRHIDQFRNDSGRKFSLINYLNQNWLEEDGGQLLVYQNNTVQKILPQAQTAVFFKSDEMEHEVSASARSRMSITGWLKRT